MIEELLREYWKLIVLVLVVLFCILWIVSKWGKEDDNEDKEEVSDDEEDDDSELRELKKRMKGKCNFFVDDTEDVEETCWLAEGKGCDGENCIFMKILNQTKGEVK